ncbi:hypothetical protein KQ939_08860 [Planococcus sp. CP5-4]|uniref:hypothetical protein n=1 Tax=unclassified Planococcus (in: firmicutes) TaxID=2662419 RepID=UPI001C239980|nr:MULTISPECIES: hypothetical protein [unclassified Planococcus (in: firmicutes)]MBU9675053.1 hypothetical protein [Planococcus sp. CP5-4_YE]MBV0910403.1 hypothetical protein [Planococcus sp. CP5-4_UN]MBW6063821.1 hypothetical protein [Planococcus sp. CP5-4]
MEERGELVKPFRNTWQALQSSKTRRTRIGSRTIRFLGYDDSGTAVNQVDIWMTQEELPVFIDALVIHPIPLPTDYLQTAEPDDNGFWVRIRSHESPKVFVSRLSSAIGCIEQPA